MEASWPPKLRKREDERDDKGRKSSMRRNSNIDEIASSRGVADSGATCSALLRQWRRNVLVIWLGDAALRARLWRDWSVCAADTL